MTIYYKNKELTSYRIVITSGSQAKTASFYFETYMNHLECKREDTATWQVFFRVSNQFRDDEFEVSFKGYELLFYGGKRGIIYGVFSFLEQIGFRFFTPTLETVPQEDVELLDFSKRECSVFEFRDVLSLGATDKEWSLKQKLNSDLWSTRKFTESDGGGYNFAGIPAHSLTGEYLLAPYVESNPEYFSLRDGIRHTDRMGQICMTNEAAIEAVIKEIYQLLEANPDKNMVSVSQGDNGNFCECECCKTAVAEKGLIQVYFDMVSKIAKGVKKRYPHVLVHTLAYAELCGVIDVPLEDNIMLQYCYGKCHAHALTDENCIMNRETVSQIEKLAKSCSNLHIWNYTNCFRHELFEFPFLHHFRSNLRFFAEIGVKGILNEGMHKEQEEADFATTYELRSYLLAKLMWNPYMSDAEFQRHLEEFCQAFYGAGYTYVIRYLELYQEYPGECASYDAIEESVTMWEGNTLRAVPIVRKSRTMEFVNRANVLLDQALAMAKGEECFRIQKLKTVVLYYELFWTMEEIMQFGTIEDKRSVLAKNNDLISRIIQQGLILTFWGQSRESQNEELDNMRDIPPNKWNYKW